MCAISCQRCAGDCQDSHRPLELPGASQGSRSWTDPKSLLQFAWSISESMAGELGVQSHNPSPSTILTLQLCCFLIRLRCLLAFWKSCAHQRRSTINPSADKRIEWVTSIYMLLLIPDLKIQPSLILKINFVFQLWLERLSWLRKKLNRTFVHVRTPIELPAAWRRIRWRGLLPRSPTWPRPSWPRSLWWSHWAELTAWRLFRGGGTNH